MAGIWLAAGELPNEGTGMEMTELDVRAVARGLLLFVFCRRTH